MDLFFPIVLTLYGRSEIWKEPFSDSDNDNMV